jgi:hypothetical protein
LPHRQALKAEREPRREFGQDLFGARPAGRAIGDEADAVAARDLAAGEIEDMAEQTADRRAENVDDVQGSHRRHPHPPPFKRGTGGD